jgi:hypothetical protein
VEEVLDERRKPDQGGDSGHRNSEAQVEQEPELEAASSHLKNMINGKFVEPVDGIREASSIRRPGM